MVIAVNGINKTNIFERLFYGLKYKIQMVLAAFAAKADCTDKNTTVVSARAEYIINTHGNSIMRLAYSYLHNMNDAEDILQETLIKYVKTAPKFENDSHEKAWLMTVAANLSKNKIDYNRIRTTDELQDTLVAEEREDLSFVWEAVKQLPSKYSEVIHLFYYEGYSTADVAKILGRNEATVRSDMSRARKQLKDILKEAYDFE